VSASQAIARLRELRANATAGPWSVINDKSPYWIVNKNGDAELGTFAVARDVWWEANAAAIVAAMNSLESLLAVAEAAQRVVEHWQLAPGNTYPSSSHAAKISELGAALQALAGGGGE